jgi:hypothetical protein
VGPLKAAFPHRPVLPQPKNGEALLFNALCTEPTVFSPSVCNVYGDQLLTCICINVISFLEIRMLMSASLNKLLSVASYQLSALT